MHTYRPRSARITAVAIVGVAAAVAGARIAGGGIRGAAPTVGLMTFLAITGVVAYWRPYVGVGGDHVVLRNVVRFADVPLSRIVHVDTKWSLELYLDDGTRVTAFAAPAPSAAAARTMRAEDGRGLPKSTYVAGTVRPGDRRGTPSGDAAALVREAWERHRTSGDRDEKRVTRGVDVRSVVALVAGAVVAVAGYLV